MPENAVGITSETKMDETSDISSSSYATQLEQAVDEFISALKEYDQREPMQVDTSKNEDDGWGELVETEAGVLLLTGEASGEIPSFAQKILTQQKFLLTVLKDEGNCIFKIFPTQVEYIEKKIQELKDEINNFREEQVGESLELMNEYGISQCLTEVDTCYSKVCNSLNLLKRVMSTGDINISKEDVFFVQADFSGNQQGVPSEQAGSSSKEEATNISSSDQYKQWCVTICYAIEEMTAAQLSRTDFMDCNQTIYDQLKRFYLLHNQDRILALIQRLEAEISHTTRKEIRDDSEVTLQINNVSEKLTNFDERVAEVYGETYRHKTHSAWCRYTGIESGAEEASALTGCQMANNRTSAQGWQESVKNEIQTLIGSDEHKLDESVVQSIFGIVINAVENLIGTFEDMTPAAKIDALNSFAEWFKRRPYFSEYPIFEQQVARSISNYIENLTVLSRASSTSADSLKRPDQHNMDEAVVDASSQTFTKIQSSNNMDVVVAAASFAATQPQSSVGSSYASASIGPFERVESHRFSIFNSETVSWAKVTMERVEDTINVFQQKIAATTNTNIVGSHETNLINELKDIIDIYLVNLCELEGDILVAGISEAHSVERGLKALLQKLTVSSQTNQDINELIKDFSHDLNQMSYSASSMDVSTHRSSSSNVNQQSDLAQSWKQVIIQQLNAAVQTGGSGISQIIENGILTFPQVDSDDEKINLASAIQTQLESLQPFSTDSISIGIAMSKMDEFIRELREKAANVSSSSSSSSWDSRKRNGASSDSKSGREKRQKTSSSSSSFSSSLFASSDATNRSSNSASQHQPVESEKAIDDAGTQPKTG